MPSTDCNPGKLGLPAGARTEARPIHLVLPVAISLIIVLLSLWQGRYNFDPHHWGLMLSNAVDLQSGKFPYRDIFIQYGFGTTMIHALSLYILGQHLGSLIIITALLYVAGLWGIITISLRLGLTRTQAVMAMALSALAHPVVIYPWPNYVAFPFLAWGLVMMLPLHASIAKSGIAGLLLALAILCREGLFPAVMVLAFAYSLVLFIASWNRQEDMRRALTGMALFWTGLLAPLIAFALMLHHYGLGSYWYELSVDLPRAYVREFMPDGPISAGFSLLEYLVKSTFKLEPRQALYLFIIVSACWIGISILASRKEWRGRYETGLVALFSLLLCSTTLHLHEVFRLATGTILGVGLVFLMLDSTRKQRWVFGIMAVLMVLTFTSFTSGNYYLPSRTDISAAEKVMRPAVFEGQRWPAHIAGFYSEFEDEMRLLQESGCGIRYQYNETRDAFLAALSPFQKYQLAPFGEGIYTLEYLSTLRSDLDVDAKIAAASDLVIWAQVAADALDNFAPPPGYSVNSRRRIPVSRFLPDGDWLMVLVPTNCAQAGSW